MSGLDSFEQVGGKKERANGWITGSSLASTDPALTLRVIEEEISQVW